MQRGLQSRRLSACTQTCQRSRFSAHRIAFALSAVSSSISSGPLQSEHRFDVVPTIASLSKCW